MDIQEAIEELRQRCRRRRNTNLIYLRWPVEYTSEDPAMSLAEEFGAHVISVIGILQECYAGRWEQLREAEAAGRLGTVARLVAEGLVVRGYRPATGLQQCLSLAP